MFNRELWYIYVYMYVWYMRPTFSHKHLILPTGSILGQFMTGTYNENGTYNEL